MHLGSVGWTDEVLEEHLITGFRELDLNNTGFVSVTGLRETLYKIGERYKYHGLYTSYRHGSWTIWYHYIKVHFVERECLVMEVLSIKSYMFDVYNQVWVFG